MRKAIQIFLIFLGIFSVFFSCQKEDTKVAVTGITMNCSSASLTEGETLSLTATISPNDAANQIVIWSSSNQSVASVTNGTVTAKAAGSAAITAKSDDGGKTATCQITVTAKIVTVTGVSLDKKTLEMVEGDKIALTASVEPENATNKDVIWSSSDEKIATVKDGEITAVKEGKATITVKTEDGGKTATCQITVTSKAISVTGIALDKTTLEMVEGDKTVLTATVEPENATNKNVIWSSSDEKVATVKDGEVTSVKEGKATITVKTDDGGKTATCQVTVNKIEEVFKIDKTSFDVDAVGGEISFTVTSNIGYEVTNNASEWITEVSIADGTDMYSKIYTYKIAENTTENTRTGVIVVCNDNSVCIPVTVKQDLSGKHDDDITLSQNNFYLEAAGGDFEFTVSSQSDYDVSSQSDWIKAKTADKASGKFVFNAEANLSKETRNGSVIVSNSTKKCVINVYQNGTGESQEKDWTKKEFAHRSLVMKQTATWCGWCPRMSRAIERAQEIAPGELEVINVYVDGSEYEFDQEAIIQNAYSIRGAPVGTVDGRRKINNGSRNVEDTDGIAAQIIEYSRETVSLYGTTTGVSFNSSINGDRLALDITAYLKYADDYRITAVLTESGIIGAQDDYDQSSHTDYVHNNVARIGFTSILGDSFSTSKDAQERTFTYSATISSEYVRENLKIVVYIQRAFRNQTRVSDYPSYNDFFNYYVDNLAVGKVGATVPLAFKSDSSGGNEGIGDGGKIEW